MPDECRACRAEPAPLRGLRKGTLFQQRILTAITGPHEAGFCKPVKVKRMNWGLEKGETLRRKHGNSCKTRMV